MNSVAKFTILFAFYAAIHGGSAHPQQNNPHNSNSQNKAFPAFTCPQGGVDGFFPSPTNCSEYYVCHSGIAYLMACPTYLYFDATINVCNWAYLVNCEMQNLFFI